MNDGSFLDNIKDFDMIVIGGGSAGFVAAIKASQLNKKVASGRHHYPGGNFSYSI